MTAEEVDMAVLEELESAARTALDAVAPSVVRIGRGGGRGCGVVIGNGLVVTNAHNLRGREVTVTFADGGVETGEVTAADVDSDLAVLRVVTGGAPAVTWSEGEVHAGQVVFVVTRAANGADRVSFGMISGTERAFRGPRGRRITGSLEHTAPLPRGSSGSPVIVAGGGVAAINTHRLGEGVYLALPADATLLDRVERLGRGEERHTPRLGIAVAPSHVARALRRSVGLPERDGLLVRGVEEGSAAGQAGIVEGDLLIRAGDRDLVSLDDLYDALDDASDAGTLTIGIVRGAEELEVGVALVTAQS